MDLQLFLACQNTFMSSIHELEKIIESLTIINHILLYPAVKCQVARPFAGVIVPLGCDTRKPLGMGGRIEHRYFLVPDEHLLNDLFLFSMSLIPQVAHEDFDPLNPPFINQPYKNFGSVIVDRVDCHFQINDFLLACDVIQELNRVERPSSNKPKLLSSFLRPPTLQVLRSRHNVALYTGGTIDLHLLKP